MNHTPGPWKVLNDSPPAVRSLNGSNVAPEVCSISDARVIAAAPDLLDACIRALLLLSDPEADDNEADRVTLVLVDALRLAGALDSKLELT